MNRKRLEVLEKKMQSFAHPSLWVSWTDKHLRVDIGAQRGEEMEFDSTLEAAAWLEKVMSSYKNVTGTACVDVRELLQGGQKKFFDAVYKGNPLTSTMFSLAGCQGQPLVALALGAWWEITDTIGLSQWRSDVRTRMEKLLAPFAALQGVHLPGEIAE